MVAGDDVARITDLLAAMTLEEKIGQLAMVSADMAISGPGLRPDYLVAVRSGRVGSLLNLWGAERTAEIQRIAIEETRLGIPLLLGFDVVHGHRTVFPIPLAEAAAFDPDLWERTARVAAEEAAEDGIALTFAPMLDVCRDPRWGRVAECPGEDTLLACRFADAKVRGFQGASLAASDAVAATAKHFVAYGAVTAGREYAPVDVSDRQLREVYLPPFKTALDAGVVAMMPAFHDLAGVPMSANPALLKRLLREAWGFEGVMISDYTAIDELILHGVAADLAEAAALALGAGMDIDMMGRAYPEGLPAALERGLVRIEQIDESVRRVLHLKQRLGLFDDPYRRGTGNADREARAAERRALAREAAQRATVLLTNRNGLLPIERAPSNVAVLGPLADAGGAMLGSWSGAGRAEEVVTLLAALREAWPETDIRHADGVGIENTDTSGIPAALVLARGADLVILCLGESAAMSGEGGSRARPDIPAAQRQLAEAVFELGRPVVLLLGSGRPLVATPLIERADATLAIWGLGSEAGHGIVDLLAGKANPSGRLPISWPVDVGQIPIFFGQRPTGRPPDEANRYSARYIDMPVEPLFAFGHGLGYTRFELGGPRLDRSELDPGGMLTVEVDVTNAGTRPGRETVLLFARDPVASIARPLLELKGMASLDLDPGTNGTVSFRLRAEDFAFDDEDGRMRLEPGTIELLVGTSARRDHLSRLEIRIVNPDGSRRHGTDA